MGTMIVSMETMKHTPTVVRGGSWWFMVVHGGLWWFMVVCGGSWWFVVVCGGFWWFLVVFGGFGGLWRFAVHGFVSFGSWFVMCFDS